MDAPQVRLTLIQILVHEHAKSARSVNTSQRTHVSYAPMGNLLLPPDPYIAKIAMPGSMGIQPRLRVPFVLPGSTLQLVPT